MFFGQVAKLLVPGGAFIATTVDCRVMAELAMLSCCGPMAANEPPGGRREIDIKNELGQLLLKIKFDEANWRRLLASPEDLAAAAASGDGEEDENFESAFGVRYNFNLLDEGDDVAAVDAPEWLVPLGRPLQALLARHGLVVAACMNFQEFVHASLNADPALSALMEKMEVISLFTGTHITHY